jgi:hypothetical protein
VDLFYRGLVLANLLPVEEATKAGSLSTLTLSQTVPRTEFDRNERIKKEESNPSARARKNTSKSLSLITRALCGIWRGFDHFGVSRIEC